MPSASGLTQEIHQVQDLLERWANLCESADAPSPLIYIIDDERGDYKYLSLGKESLKLVDKFKAGFLQQQCARKDVCF